MYESMCNEKKEEGKWMHDEKFFHWKTTKRMRRETTENDDAMCWWLCSILTTNNTVDEEDTQRGLWELSEALQNLTELTELTNPSLGKKMRRGDKENIQQTKKRKSSSNPTSLLLETPSSTSETDLTPETWVGRKRNPSHYIPWWIFMPQQREWDRKRKREVEAAHKRLYLSHT